jgi:oligosaccharide repeat unit polymerase
LVFALLTLPFYFHKLNFLSVSSYADTAFTSRIERSADDTLGPTDVFLREMPASLLICACTYLAFDKRRLFPVRLVAALVIGSFLMTAILAGARGELVSIMMPPLMYYHYRVRRLRLLPVVLASVLGYLTMNFIEIARKSSDPAEMLSLISQQIGLEGFAFLNVERFGEFQTSQNLVRIIEGIDAGEDTFRLGVVTLFNVLSTVPRILWPERPPTGSELFAEVFHPGSLEAGQGFGSFLLQDPYWDFGFPGVFVFAAALAFTVRRIHMELIVQRRGAFVVFLYAIVFNYLVIQVVRSGIFAGIKGGLVASAPLLAIIVLPRRREVERSRS